MKSEKEKTINLPISKSMWTDVTVKSKREESTCY